VKIKKRNFIECIIKIYKTLMSVPSQRREWEGVVQKTIKNCQIPKILRSRFEFQAKGTLFYEYDNNNFKIENCQKQLQINGMNHDTTELNYQF